MSEEIYKSSDGDCEDAADVATELWHALCQKDEPGAYAYGSNLCPLLPGLHLDGYGEVSFPFKEYEAQQVIALCKQACAYPDTDVSRTWQLDPSAFKLLNEDFVQQINSLAITVAAELGLGPSANVTAQLSKLLIDEPGGHYSPHKDSEKAPGMFASLVVTLPSIFSGGELVVRHQGMTKTFTPARPAYNTTYTAFFADCEHEMSPVTSGYRLALLYNLISLDNGPVPQPPSSEPILQAVNCFQKWSDLGTPSQAIFLLGHKYKPKKLHVGALKGSDKAKMQVLQEASQGRCFLLLLAVVKYTNEGELQEDWLGSNSVSKFHKSFTLTSLINGNERIDIRMRLNTSDVFYSAELGRTTPDSKNTSEWSQTLNYERAAIVIVPTDKLVDFISNGDQLGVIRYLHSLASKCTVIESRDASEWNNCIRLATLLIAKEKLEFDATLMNTLLLINDIALVQQYIGKVQLGEFWRQIAEFIATLDKCLIAYGWEHLSGAIQQLTQRLSIEKSVKVMDHLTSFITDDITALTTLRAMLTYAVKSQAPAETRSLSQKTVVDLARLANVIDPTLLADVFKYVYSHYSNVDSEFVPILKLLHEQVPSLVQRSEFINIANQCINFLKNRMVAALARADDWSVSSQIGCTCEPCMQVNVFLRSSKLLEHRCRAAERVRSHVSQMLYATKLPNHGIIHVYVDNGHTLVVCKTAKELDVAKETAKLDEFTIAELTNMLTTEQEPATKRPKIEPH